MKKRNNKKKSGINKRISHLGRLSSKSNIVIDKFGEEYIVVSPIINQKSILNPRTIKFALGDTTKEKEVEKLIKRNHIRGGKTFLGRLSSKSNIVIDKFGEEYIVVSPIINQKSILNPRTIKFALGDTTKEKEVEKLIKRNHIRGGKTYVTSRVLNKTNEDDGGVWPPFMPKDIEVVEVKDVKIVKIKE